MPAHDWTKVEGGVFHHFHHAWIEEITRGLNGGLLPGDYYAMAEQHVAGFGPDVVTLELTSEHGAGNGRATAHGDSAAGEEATGGDVLLAPPQIQLAGETDMEFYRRKQNHIAVRHVSGDRVVAMVEVVSPGNKASRSAIRSFAEKAAELLDRRIHPLILDLVPPGPRDPHGIHALIWDEIAGREYVPPGGQPLTLAAYETDLSVKAYVETLAIGKSLTDMPLFLEPGAHIRVPLEPTYQAAFAAVPRRWQRVLAGTY